MGRSQWDEAVDIGTRSVVGKQEAEKPGSCFRAMCLKVALSDSDKSVTRW